ncbi:MAG: hypothetical protein NVS3B3_23120 [Aquirhabdus sp.]
MNAIAVNPMHELQEDDSRDRRLEPGEEQRIRDVLNRVKKDNKERAFALPYQAALELLFDMAIETAMRMREMYTLQMHQIDLDAKHISLYKRKSDYATKTKVSRHIPLTPKMIRLIREYMEIVKKGERGMAGFDFDSGCLFPWVKPNETENRYAQVSARLSGMFTRIFEEAGCSNLKFHDLRHEGISRLFENTSFKATQIKSISGHSSDRMLARYTNLRPGDLAEVMHVELAED